MKKSEVYIKGNHPLRESIENQYIRGGYDIYDCLDDCSAFIENRMNAEMVILTSPCSSNRLQEDCNVIHFMRVLSGKMPDNDGIRPIVQVLLQSSGTLDYLL